MLTVFLKRKFHVPIVWFGINKYHRIHYWSMTLKADLHTTTYEIGSKLGSDGDNKKKNTSKPVEQRLLFLKSKIQTSTNLTQSTNVKQNAI